MAQWFAVYRTSTGELMSTGTVLASPMPGDTTVLPIVAEPDFSAQRWNAVLKVLEAWVVLPPAAVLLIDLLEAQPEISGLGAGAKATLHTVLQRLGAAQTNFMDRLEAQAEFTALGAGQKAALHAMLLRLNLQTGRGD